MEISDLRKDASLISAGVWVKDIPGMGDLRLKVRGLTSKPATKLRSELERKAVKKDRNPDGTLKQEANVAILTEVLHSVILLDWDGITDQGKPVEYSAELAKEFLTNPDLRTFADAVTWAANVVDNGYTETVELVVGNSSQQSDSLSPKPKQDKPTG